MSFEYNIEEERLTLFGLAQNKNIVSYCITLGTLSPKIVIYLMLIW